MSIRKLANIAPPHDSCYLAAISEEHPWLTTCTITTLTSTTYRLAATF